jgi:aspartyl-tRNA(Asn)/glutamyl-tRNA(Gln) amidotransferase subunit C
MMTELIDPDTFTHLIELAALEIDSEHGEYLRAQLNNQLKAIQELVSIPLDEDVPINLHGVSYSQEISQPLREDVWSPYPDPKGIIAQAPDSEDGYLIVPDIPHTTLE